MSDNNFVPNNGQNDEERINDLIRKGCKYDPVTGEPLWTRPVPEPDRQVINPANVKRGNQKGVVIAIVAAVLVMVIALFFIVGTIFARSINNFINSGIEVTMVDPGPEPEPEPTVQRATPGMQSKTNVDMESMSSFSINGYCYELPQKVQDFVDDDWVFNDDRDMTTVLASGESKYVYLHVPGDISDNTIEFIITNYSLDALELQDCYVVGVELFDANVSTKGNEILVCNGELSLCESSSDDVIEVLGEPDYVTDIVTSCVYTYYYEHDNYNYNHEISFHVEADTDTVHIITIRNYDTPEDFEQVEVQDDYIPECVMEYEAPAELGNDLLSGNVEIEGKVYNVPVSMRQLLDDGWTYKNDVQAVGAYARDSVTMVKDTAYIYVDVYNNSEKAVSYDNSMVTKISFYESAKEKMNVKFPGGLTLDVTDKEFRNMLEEQEITNYEYRKDFRTYRIPFNQSSKADDYNNELIVRFYDNGSLDNIQIGRRAWLED